MTTINKIVLKEISKLKDGDRINFDYLVKEGAATIEFVLIVRKSGNDLISYKQNNLSLEGGKSSVHVSRAGNKVPWIVAGGEKYIVKVYFYQKLGYEFKEVNGNAVCDVMLSDGTLLTSSGCAIANGKNCYCFSYEMEVDGQAEVSVDPSGSVNESQEPSKTIDKVVLNAPKLMDGKAISYDYIVKEGCVSVEWVTYVRSRDNKYFINKQEYPILTSGEKYTVHIYLYQKPGYVFREENGNAVCDVQLADGTKLMSSSYMIANGKRCCHFFYEAVVAGKAFVRTELNSSECGSNLLSRVSWRKSADGFSRYVKQLDECLAYNPLNVAADHIRHLSFINQASRLKLVIYYQKPGSIKWESVSLGTFLPGNITRSFDLVSKYDFPLNTLIQVEIVVVATKKSEKWSGILKVHPETSKKANFVCVGSSTDCTLKLEIK